jgi:glucokinase
VSSAGSVGVCLGIDIGGTKTLGIALDAENRVVAEARVPTPLALEPPGQAPGTQAIGAVVDVVSALRAELGGGTGAANQPIGVGAPGMLRTDGFLSYAPNLPSAHGADVMGMLSRALPGDAIVVENDANLSALAEMTLGAAVGSSNALMVTLGTGIGGAFIIAGRVVRGSRGYAGEIGHMVVDPTGPPCPCGRRGCWERYASGGGLGRLAREAAHAGRLANVVALAGGDPESVRGEHVTRAASQGDEGALSVFEEFGWWVAMGLANLTAVVDPDRIVVGGGLIEAGDLLLVPTRRAFGDLVEGGTARPEIDIVPATLGERAGAIGGALAARAGGL